VPFSEVWDPLLRMTLLLLFFSLGLKAATSSLLDILKGISSQVASILGGNTDTVSVHKLNPHASGIPTGRDASK